jgi:hypothetical protein
MSLIFKFSIDSVSKLDQFMIILRLNILLRIQIQSSPVKLQADFEHLSGIQVCAFGVYFIVIKF